MKLIFLDLETTGLDPRTHEIIEIAAVGLDDGPVFSVKVQPLSLGAADPESLRVNGYKPEDWGDAVLLPQALAQLSAYVGTDRPLMAGYNIGFDMAFLEAAYRSCEMEFPFHYRSIDVHTLVWDRFQQSLSLRNASLAFDLAPEPSVHRALNGALCAYQVYKKLL